MAIVNKTAMLTEAAALIKENRDEGALQMLYILARYEIENILFDNIGEYNRSGTKLEMPKTFGDMHDFCDANELGGLCTVLICEEFGEDDEGCMTERQMDFCNALQNKLHHDFVCERFTPQVHFFI